MQRIVLLRTGSAATSSAPPELRPPRKLFAVSIYIKHIVLINEIHACFQIFVLASYTYAANAPPFAVHYVTDNEEGFDKDAVTEAKNTGFCLSFQLQ